MSFTNYAEHCGVKVVSALRSATLIFNLFKLSPVLIHLLDSFTPLMCAFCRVHTSAGAHQSVTPEIQYYGLLLRRLSEYEEKLFVFWGFFCLNAPQQVGGESGGRRAS